MKTDWSKWEPVREAMTSEEQEEFDHWREQWKQRETESFAEWIEKQFLLPKTKFVYGVPPIRRGVATLQGQVCPNCSIAYVGTHCPRCTARIE